MWRSIFLHEFIDHRLSNFQAVAGSVTQASFNLTPKPAPGSGINSVEVTAGTGFEYVFAQPLEQIIGVSCRLRVSFPFPNAGTGHVRAFNILTLGQPTSGALIQTLAFKEPSLSGAPSQTGLFIGQSSASMGTVNISSDSFTDLRVDWHTSGQARLSVNGRLAGYTHSLSPGTVFDADRMTFGFPDGLVEPHNPNYLIARVFVRVLRRADSLATLTRLLPQIDIGDDRNRCRVRAFVAILRLLDRLRSFMATFHQAMSQPWSEVNGPPEGPFRPEAIRAHELALAVGRALSRMLSDNDFSNPDAFLDPFTEFLQILRTALPAEFDSLAAELQAADVIPDDCKQDLEYARQQNEQVLAPIEALLSAASDRVKAVAGGGY